MSYGAPCLCTACLWFDFSSCWLFWFTSFIFIKTLTQQPTARWWHNMVRIDCTNRPYLCKTGKDGKSKRSSSSNNIPKVPHQSNAPSFSSSFTYLFYYSSKQRIHETRTNQIDTVVRYNNSNSNSNSNSSSSNTILVQFSSNSRVAIATTTIQMMMQQSSNNMYGENNNNNLVHYTAATTMANAYGIAATQQNKKATQHWQQQQQ